MEATSFNIIANGSTQTLNFPGGYLFIQLKFVAGTASISLEADFDNGEDFYNVVEETYSASQVVYFQLPRCRIRLKTANASGLNLRAVLRQKDYKNS